MRQQALRLEVGLMKNGLQPVRRQLFQIRFGFSKRLLVRLFFPLRDNLFIILLIVREKTLDLFHPGAIRVKAGPVLLEPPLFLRGCKMTGADIFKPVGHLPAGTGKPSPQLSRLITVHMDFGDPFGGPGYREQTAMLAGEIQIAQQLGSFHLTAHPFSRR